MASNPIQMTESDYFCSLDYGYPPSSEGCNSALYLRLSAEESVMTWQRILHYRTRTLYPCIYMSALLEGEFRS